MKCYRCGKELKFNKNYVYYCPGCDKRPEYISDDEEDFMNLLSELTPTPFFLHFTSEQNWKEIQKEGLVPQPQEKSRIEETLKSNGVQIPNSTIWLGREPDEVYINKLTHPIVIAVPMNHKKFGLQKTFSESEYIAVNCISPEEFLGIFDFTKHIKDPHSFLEWLNELKQKIV